VCDIFNVCDQAVVSIFVNAINDLPVVQNDSFTTNEDVVLSGSLAQNDSDVETAVLNYAVLSGTAHGNLVLSGDGTFVYTPNANFFGTDQAQIQIADVGSPVNTTTSWLYITVVGVDDVTQVTNDNFSVAAGYTLNGNVSTNDTDADALSLNYSLIGPVQGGSMTFNANGSFVFVASLDYFGTQLIPYQVCDEDGTCANGVMTITVTPYNHEPTAMSTTLNACEGEIISIPLNSLVADADENSATLQLTALSGIGGALNFIDLSRIIVFEPQQGFTGDATLFYSVCDNGLPQLCASGVITIHYDSIVVPAILNEEVQMVSCFGGTDGSIWLETNAPGSVIVTWNDGVTGEVRSNLIAGTYNATLTTDAACSAEGQYSVTIVEPDQLSISGLLGFYDGSQAGSSDYMVTGGTEPYQYTWTNDAGEIISTDKILATALPGTYTVTIYDANGCSLSQDVDASTGVVESDLDMELLLYPNPAVNFLKVQFSAYKGGKALLRVFDARGKVVLDKICWITPGLNYNLIDVSNLSQGVYLLSVQGEEFKTDCSFVKAQ
jgi:hypothetical protein